MTYALIVDGAVAAYPYSEAELRADNPNTSFPVDISETDLSHLGVVTVETRARPTMTAEETCDEGTPTFSAGKWRQAWVKRNRTAEELAAAKAAALVELAALRYQKETAGITYGGKLIPTDRATCAILTGAYVRATRNPTFSINFKSPNNTWTPINAATLIAVGDAVSDHVQACFDRELALSTAINGAATFAALNAIDIGSGWPT